jgi:competence protein ComEC
MNIKKTRLILLFLLWLIAIIRYFFWWPETTAEDLAFYNDQGKITFTGLVVKDPDRRLDQVKLMVASQKLKGRVLISVNLYPEYYYGDLLAVTCQLQKPEPIENFAYDKYLAKNKTYSLCYQPQVKLLSHNQGNWFYQQILSVKNRFRLIIDRSLARPYSALLFATLFGGGQNLSPALQEDFSRVGITHIIAVSGSHVVLITAFLCNLFLALGLRRKVAFYFIIFSLLIFVIMIGLPAAAVRSVIMGVVGLGAMQVGRLNKSSWALVLSASLMLVVNPLLLFYDVGFELSFLATWGMIKFSGPINQLFLKLKLKLPEILGLRESLVATLAAQLATLPLIIYQFGKLSLIAPLVNLLILPVVPAIMLLGIAAAVVGLFSLKIASILFWLVFPFLFYFIKVVEISAGWSWAAVAGLKVGGYFLVISYLLLVVLIYKKYFQSLWLKLKS